VYYQFLKNPRLIVLLLHKPGAPLSATENFGIGYGLSTIPESAQNNTILTDGNIAGLTGNSNFIAGGNSLGSTGAFVGSSMTNAVENVVIGQSTADKITTGSNNTIIGVNAGNGIETGSNNTLYGHAAEVDAENANHRIVIGAGATGTADNGLFVPSNLAGFTGTNVDNTVVLKNSTTGQMGPLEELGTTGPYPLVSDGFGKIGWNVPEYAYFTGGTSPNIGTSFVEITWNADPFPLSGTLIGRDNVNNRITIGANGIYEVYFDAGYDSTSNGRKTATTILSQSITSPTSLTNSTAYSYHRNLTDRAGSISINWVGLLSSGVLTAWVRLNSGSCVTLSDATRLTIKLLYLT